MKCLIVGNQMIGGFSVPLSFFLYIFSKTYKKHKGCVLDIINKMWLSVWFVVCAAA